MHKLNAQDGDKNKILLRIPMKYGGKQSQFRLTRLQFPFTVAFLFTMKRALGQSATKCGILLPESVWIHEQIYIALLPICRNPNKFCIWAEEEQFTERGKLLQRQEKCENVVSVKLFYSMKL